MSILDTIVRLRKKVKNFLGMKFTVLAPESIRSLVVDVDGQLSSVHAVCNVRYCSYHSHSGNFDLAHMSSGDIINDIVYLAILACWIIQYM